MTIQVLERSEDGLRLMQRVLRDGEALAPEYPLVFGAGAPGRVAVLREHGATRSACALLPRELVFPGGELRVGLIGSVSTETSHRGRGLASRTLDAAEGALRDQGCLAALLWADDGAFYVRRGYGPVGNEVVLPLEPELESLLPLPGGVRPADPRSDATAVHALYLRHARRVRRSLAETAASLAVPGMRTLVRVHRGKLVAYACEGRGRDLQGVVHEWGGAVEDVAACLRAILSARLGLDPRAGVFLLAPHAHGELVRRLARLGAAPIGGILAQGKLLDPDGALERIAGHARARLDLERVSAERWSLARGNRRIELGLEELRALLLAPRASRAAVHDLEQRLDVAFPGLPLAPFVWGLDSI